VQQNDKMLQHLRARLVGCTTPKQALGSKKWVDWMPGLPQNHVSHASKQPGARPSTYHRFGCFHGARAYEEQREALPARLVKEHGTPCCFHARAINSRHRPTPPLFSHSLSSHSLSLSLSLLNLFPQTSGCFLSQC
jgi:hypothetical protein